MQRTDDLLHQTNYWRDMCNETITKMGVAAFNGDQTEYARLKYDLETYLRIHYRFNRKLANASTSDFEGT